VSGSAVLLVGHGSRTPGAGETVRAVAAALADRVRRPVEVAHVELDPPDPAQALVALADRGFRHVDVVPLLFAPGHHVTVDVPRFVAAALARRTGLTVRRTGALLELPGAAELLLDALDDRLAAVVGGSPVDALVLAASGSSSPRALAAVEALALRWSRRRRLPTRAASASGTGPAVGDVVRELAGQGQQVAVGSLFLAPGRLPDRARQAALGAGALAVADVLGAHPALVDLLAQQCSSGATGRPVRVSRP
jgi:sirohydrochlorin ferrochelatase